MKQNYLALGNTVIVKALKPDSKLQLPSSYQPENYLVYSVGDGDEVSDDLEPGNVVILNSAASLQVIKDTEYRIVNVNDVLAIIIEDEME